MKIFVRQKGDVLTTPPVAELQGNPLVLAKCICAIVEAWDDETIKEIVHYNLKEIESGGIDYFTTDLYLVSTVKSFSVPASFTTVGEVPA